jgi:hypothetical protein
MADARDRLSALGVAVPNVYLPGDGVSLETWSVVACDQFTSEPDYWSKTEELVGDSPSALRIILPEAYLEKGRIEDRISAINDTMRGYLDRGVLAEVGENFILVDRSTTFVSSRKGLILAVDLENYSFDKGAEAMIRPTEGTVLERIPPRMDIRRGAVMDMPHILLLVDDPKGTLIETLYNRRNDMEKVYDFELIQNGGHISGWRVPGEMENSIAEALEGLLSKGLLFAVGDGNHSLAAAKGIWEENKAAGAPMDHPSRWALVEVENVHDEGLPFHPIHRVLFGLEPERFVEEMAKALGGSFKAGAPVTGRDGDEHRIGLSYGTTEGSLSFVKSGPELTVEHIQAFLDDYLEGRDDVAVDYIHGEDVVSQLSRADGNIGILLPDVDKESFFDRIRNVGPYPRKTFSIGEASEKRYYLETRRLTLD